MPELRAFLAIPLPQPLKEQVEALQTELKPHLRGVRWARTETLHLTLKFFGDIPEESLEKIGEIVLSVVNLCPPFAVAVKGVGAFPSLDRPRVFWLGLADTEPLKELYAALEERWPQIGIEAERRPFTPHLTLGRAKSRLASTRTALEPYREFSGGALPVNRLILFKSQLTPSGAIHHPLRTFPLQGAGC